jgi:uncharacterized membrane protein YhiD involved in acid resistance
VGIGAYVLAIFTSVVALAILIPLAPVSKRLAERARLRADAAKIGQKARPVGGEESEERHWEEENE